MAYLTKKDFEGMELPSNPSPWECLNIVTAVASQRVEEEEEEEEANINNDDNNDETTVVLPERIRLEIARLGGTEPWLVMNKKVLFESDMKKDKNRLSMPLGNEQVARWGRPGGFLRLGERAVLKGKRSLNVTVLIDTAATEVQMKLSKWNMHKKNGRVNSEYVLNGSWYKNVVSRNDLKIDDILQIWSFRSKVRRICFALVLTRQP